MNTRTEIINHLINKFGYKSFLEIGVRYGENFRGVHCPLKHGVDIVRQCSEVTHPMPSDEFFANHCNMKYDIIFIDGHHDSEYVHRDFNNSLRYLADGGTIMLHDCFPGNKSWSLKLHQIGENAPIWNGDSFKVVASMVRNYRDKLDVCVVDIDHGVGVVQVNAASPFEISYDDSYEYDTMKSNPSEEINLISVDEFVRKFS